MDLTFGMDKDRALRVYLGLAVLLAIASIAGAWFSELVLGYAPCKLCLVQRWPYYIGIPVGLAALLAGGWSTKPGQALTWLFVLIFFVSIVLGVYHSGVEWKWWAGPTDCTGALNNTPMSIEDFRKSLKTVRVVRCDDAAVRVLGFSFAGWNAIVSVLIVALPFYGRTSGKA